ncbi:MAG: rod shape-determining protein RodA [Gammaproteobacteria bacterium]|nr:rod shape-determining protein RodA [Gammaproteobacteria bacterium]
MRTDTNPPYIDLPLFSVVLMLFGLSLVILYSASGEDMDRIMKHGIRFGFGLVLLVIFARIPPRVLLQWSPHVYLTGLILLMVVLAIGIIGKGAQRWLDLGFFRFQPSEIMRIAIPMMIAWILARTSLPPKPLSIFLGILVVLLPTVLVILQPDLGTAILIAMTGITVIFLSGIGWKLIFAALFAISIIAPAMWVFVLHDYQRSRVLTLFDPWADPLGAGYHIIQSIIAIGSGGFQGKGWLSGTQSQLEFIPERSTDFIFSVFAEEFGLIGVVVLLMLYLFLVFRGLMIAFYAQNTYSRLLAGGLSATYFFYVFVNIGMVAGILPVVGVPLPLMSYGGSSMVTLMIGFGILMSIARSKKIP